MSETSSEAKMSVNDCAKCVYRAPGQDNFRSRPRACFGLYEKSSGFTLIELLVVVAIIAIMAAILLPVFVAAKEGGNKAKCASQLRQLLAASLAYADDNNGRYVPAARDLYSSNPEGGQWRWHGWRPRRGKNFDPAKGPLWPYLGKCGGLKKCPSSKYLKTVDDVSGINKINMFESGTGGYGYNAMYVGGTFYKNYGANATGYEPYEIASLTSDIARPSRTVMFADTAIATADRYFQEYSFVEPPHHISVDTSTGNVIETGASTPTVHFRHNNTASVGWCDGHVTAEKMGFTRPGTNVYGADNKLNNLGYIGSGDNSFYDNR